MSKVTVEPFRAEHYDESRPELSAEGPHPSTIDSATLARFYEKRGVAFTLRIDGEIAACIGVVCPWPGLGQVWATVTPVGREHGRALTLAVARTMRGVARALGLRRLEADIREDFAAGRRWAEALGYREESRMPKYGPSGENFVRYVLFLG